MKLAALFPGQGSQQIGMGVKFVEQFEEAREIFSKADAALGFSLSLLCAEGPMETLTLTAHAQPAILSVSYIAYRLSGVTPLAAAGHSLGEYSALVAANSLRFEDAVQLVHKRGRYMQEATPAGAGGMVAVLGPAEDEINAVIGRMDSGVAEIANLNTPGQTVVAGDKEGLALFSRLMQEKGGKIIPLQVSAPFHCRLMAPAAEKLATDLDAISIVDAAFPIYANVTAEPVQRAGDVRNLLKKQVCSTVRWSDSVANLLRDFNITHTVEFGTGSVLTKMMKRIDRKAQTLSAEDPASLEQLRALL